MTETRQMNFYERFFAKSNKTDAILVVDGKKLHVNKALLSYHSDYFEALFNAEFKEKSMEEIEIKDVTFKDFAILLSLIQKNQLVPSSGKNAENILELANRFLLPAAKPHVELFLTNTRMDKFEKLRIADKYDLEHLRKQAIYMYNSKEDFRQILERTKEFSDNTKAKLYGKYIKLSY
ncbi:unnamed protein product [Caenorhabditis brenneri]